MNSRTFPPAKRAGLLYHVLLMLLGAGISSWALWMLSGTDAGPAFILYLLLGIAAFIPIPLLGYRAYALYRAQYRLDRDSLELRWGLRDELVPLGEIEWVRRAKDLVNPVRLPAVRMPGAIIGLRRHPDLGVIEFLASRSHDLLLVAARERVYAISPAEPAEFMETFARAVELGSLREAEPRSQYPVFVIAEAWNSGLARYMWLASLFINVGLAAWVSILIPASPRFALGFRPDATPEAVPSPQLVIIPLVSALVGLIGWIAGLFLYRLKRRRVLAFMIWGSSLVSSLAFLLGVLFIVTTPV